MLNVRKNVCESATKVVQKTVNGRLIFKNAQYVYLLDFFNTPLAGTILR